jgi:hypothetical protein
MTLSRAIGFITRMSDVEEDETNRRRREEALRIIAAKLLQRRRALTDKQLLDQEAQREAERAKRTRTT